MSDIVERLEEPEAHYPGNFNTPKRANAMLSCLCQEAAEEIESLRQQLAEAKAEIGRLKEILMHELEYQLNNGNEVSKFAGSYLATPQEKL